MNNNKQIGWFILKEDHEFTNTYECAAWYENVMVKAGRYPLVVHDYHVRKHENENWNNEIDGYIGMASVMLPGVITTDEFGARFCGVPVGTYDNYKNKGKESSYHHHQYLYGIADRLLRGEESIFYNKIYEYELFPEYEPRDTTFISYDGKEVTTHGIFLKED